MARQDTNTINIQRSDIRPWAFSIFLQTDGLIVVDNWSVTIPPNQDKIMNQTELSLTDKAEDSCIYKGKVSLNNEQDLHGAPR